MVYEPRKQSMAWMETDCSKHMYFRWKIKWRLAHLGALGIMGETAPLRWNSLVTNEGQFFINQFQWNIRYQSPRLIELNTRKTSSRLIDMEETKLPSDVHSPFYKPGLRWLPSCVQRLTMCGAADGFLPRLERKNRHTIQQQRGEAKLDWTSSPTEAPTITSWEILAERRDYTTPTNPRGQCRYTPSFPILEKPLSKDAAFWYCGSIFVPRWASHIQACLLKLLWNPSQI